VLLSGAIPSRRASFYNRQTGRGGGGAFRGLGGTKRTRVFVGELAKRTCEQRAERARKEWAEEDGRGSFSRVLVRFSAR